MFTHEHNHIDQQFFDLLLRHFATIILMEIWIACEMQSGILEHTRDHDSVTQNCCAVEFFRETKGFENTQNIST